MVGRGAAPHRALQQQVELLAHPVLGDELGQPLRAAPWPRRRAPPARRSGLDQRVGHRVRPSSRIACLSSTGTGGVVAVDGLGHRGHRLVGLRRRPAEPDQGLAHLLGPGACGAPALRPAARPAPGRSGRAAPAPAARRPSCRCPAPGSASRCRRWRSPCAPRRACAPRAPPGPAAGRPRWRSAAARTACFASSSAKPYRVSESSRTTRLVASRAGWPTRSAGERAPGRSARPGRPRRPRPRRRPGRSRPPCPRTLAIIAASSSCPFGRALASFGSGAAAPDVADGQRQRVGGVGRPRRRRPAAAAGSPSAVTCALSAWPEPVTAALTSLGV